MNHILKKISAAGIVTFAGILFFVYTKNSLPWSSISAQVPIERNEWQVVINPVSYQELWKAPALESKTEQLLIEGRAHTVWAGINIPEETMRAAAERNANHFILGSLKGSFTVWLNGKNFARYEDRNEPYVIAVPVDLLKQKLQISIQLQPRANALNALPFTAGSKAGFATEQTAAAYLAQHDFLDKTKPMGLLALGAFLVSLCFFYWNKNRDSRTLLFLAGFTALSVLPEIVMQYQLSAIALLAKSAIALNLGFCFARANSALLKKFSLAFVLLGASLVLFSPAQNILIMKFSLYQLVLPFMFWIGGMACLLKATWGKPENTARFFHLMGFSVSFFALGALSILQTNPGLDIFLRKFLTGMPELLIAALMGYVAIRDQSIRAGAKIIPFPGRAMPSETKIAA